MIKRATDILFSVIGLLVTSPLFLAIALRIWLEDGRPIFYRGERVGRFGKPFRMLKFRTMVAHAERVGGTSTAKDDPRITRAGRFLRRHKLDELPQLINVLRGEMSLVGPRPQVEWAVALYDAGEQALLSVRPGMTDYASIRFRNEGELLRGSADPDREYLEKIAPEKIRLGLSYVRHHSLGVDLRIIAATLLSLTGGHLGERLAGDRTERPKRQP
jgi:lipopolysaccharide/colanic/teichoic acid biosynthesis glycosyltransferase